MLRNFEVFGRGLLRLCLMHPTSYVLTIDLPFPTRHAILDRYYGRKKLDYIMLSSYDDRPGIAQRVSVYGLFGFGGAMDWTAQYVLATVRKTYFTLKCVRSSK